MLSIEISHPEVYEKVLNDKFVAQLNETNPFGNMELDKVIEVIINCETKTSEGTASFARSNDVVNR